MTHYVALLGAVNVGGTDKLLMSYLRAMREAAGFADVRTYIASGNVLFTSPLGEAAVSKNWNSNCTITRANRSAC